MNIHDSQDSREGGGHLFNSSLALPSLALCKHLDISWVITAESSHVGT